MIGWCVLGLMGAGLAYIGWAAVDEMRERRRTRDEEDCAAIALSNARNPFSDDWYCADAVIPDRARSVKWESAHLFNGAAALPYRFHSAIHVPEPPLAMACPECDCRQPVLHPGLVRGCGYCGATIVAHGSRVYWWMEGEGAEVPEWKAAR